MPSIQSNTYLERLKKIYSDYKDQNSLEALADIDRMYDRARELTVYREQPKTQELINAALERYKQCLMKLTDKNKGLSMSPEERAYCFAAMDWATFTLDIVGESPEMAEGSIDELVLSYARKAGIST